MASPDGRQALGMLHMVAARVTMAHLVHACPWVHLSACTEDLGIELWGEACQARHGLVMTRLYWREQQEQQPGRC